MLPAFVLKVVLISMSGVMAPGPVTAATIASGARQRHGGALVALGHGVIEFPLMFLIMLGAGQVFHRQNVKIGIGLIGGAFLAWMGAKMLAGLRRPAGDAAMCGECRPFVAGIVLTATNPYFLLWWATIGLALAAEARALGVMAFVLFGIVHWLCDLGWLELLSVASFRGTSLMGARGQRRVLAVCAAAVLLFAVKFIYDAGAQLARTLAA